MSYKYCCDEFEGAVSDPMEEIIYAYEGRWRVNSDALVAVYCPFCGVKLRAPPASSDPTTGQQEKS